MFSTKRQVFHYAAVICFFCLSFSLEFLLQKHTRAKNVSFEILRVKSCDIELINSVIKS